MTDDVKEQLDLGILERQAIGNLLDWQVLADSFLEVKSPDDGNALFTALLQAEDNLLATARRIRVMLAVQMVSNPPEDDDDDNVPF